MLTREEVISMLEADECYTDQFGGDERMILRRPLAIQIIELLKQHPEQPRREIVEISHAFDPNQNDGKGAMHAIARCNDKTAWSISFDGVWRKIPPIPQDDNHE